MGNQNSLSSEKNGTDDKLLRRNMRSAFSQSNQTGEMFAANEFSLPNYEAQRQARSRSLEPRTMLEIRSIEHSKSARLGGRSKKHSVFVMGGSCGSSSGASEVPAAQLWNPEEQRLELLRLQLQNPQYGSRDGDNRKPKMSLGHLKDEEFRRQLRTIVLMNRRKDCLETMGNNVTEQEQVHRSITGLSTHQTQILQKIWTRATENDVIDCTRNIFAHLLRSNIRMYQFFNLTDKTDKEILESATFARQSANFAMVFDYVITNMAHLEKVCFALQCLGERHSRLPYPVENSHWQLFTRVFEDNPPKIVFQNAEGHAVWKTMIGFIIQQMRIGYDRVVSDDDPGVQQLSTGHSLDGKATCRPKSAQSQYSYDSGSQRELSRRQQFASHRRSTVQQPPPNSNRLESNTPNSGPHHMFTTTTSCV